MSFWQQNRLFKTGHFWSLPAGVFLRAVCFAQSGIGLTGQERFKSGLERKAMKCPFFAPSSPFIINCVEQHRKVAQAKEEGLHWHGGRITGCG
jgi:hypothetical protein